LKVHGTIPLLLKTFRYRCYFDARFGGHVASYANRYGTAYGWLNTSLDYRDAEYGGVSWSSKYADSNGQTFTDGVIPEGVFAIGQMVTAPSGARVDVGGLTYQEAVTAGHIEPTHAGFYHYFTNSWGQGVINDSWFNELSYIALRNISVGYTLPRSLAQSLKAQNLYIGFNARNLGYLYNTMPNNMNPESFRGTTSDASFLQRSVMPYTATYTFTLSVDF
jgi:iron complex outermembrane recepter protein